MRPRLDRLRSARVYARSPPIASFPFFIHKCVRNVRQLFDASYDWRTVSVCACVRVCMRQFEGFYFLSWFFDRNCGQSAPSPVTRAAFRHKHHLATCQFTVIVWIGLLSFSRLPLHRSVDVRHSRFPNDIDRAAETFTCVAVARIPSAHRRLIALTFFFH